MTRISALLFTLGLSIFLVGSAAANEFMTQVIKDSPSRVVCEISPRDGATKSYAIFHLMGFDDKGVLRYRGFTAAQIEIRITPDGKLLSSKTPCLSDPVPFQ